MKTVVLPSGAKLDITASPFAVAKNLFQSVLKELKSVKVDSQAQVFNLAKDTVCSLICSPEVEAALSECMKKVAYKDKRITADTFEAIDAREDYLEVCYEVAKENLTPFMRHVYAQYSPLLEKLKSTLA